MAKERGSTSGKYESGQGRLTRGWRRCLGLLVCLWVAMALVAATGGTAAAQGSADPGPAGAQDLRIQQMRVQVLPEFDDPRVLVIVQGRLDAPDTAFPLPITFRLPQGAQINQMATISMGGDMDGGGTVAQQFDTRPEADDPRWQLVTYELDNGHFFYEYYYDPIAGDADKTFTFVLNSLHPIDDLLVEVQQPATAENMSLSPAPIGTRLDQTFGLTYHQLDAGSLAAGQETSFAVGYTKTDPAPSLSWNQVMAIQDAAPPSAPPQPVEASARPASTRIPTEALTLLGGILLASVVAIAWRRRRAASAPLAQTTIDSQARFCRMCGTALKANACFCHFCGTPVQVEMGKACV